MTQFNRMMQSKKAMLFRTKAQSKRATAPCKRMTVKAHRRCPKTRLVAAPAM